MPVSNLSTTDSVSNVYVACNDSPRFNVVEYDTSGDELWRRDLDRSPRNLTIDSVGNAYFILWQENTENHLIEGSDLIKVNDNANQLWGIELAGIAVNISTDSAGSVYVDQYLVEGAYFSNLIGEDRGLFKFDTNGNELWRRQLHSPTGLGASGPPSTPLP